MFTKLTYRSRTAKDSIVFDNYATEKPHYDAKKLHYGIQKSNNAISKLHNAIFKFHYAIFAADYAIFRPAYRVDPQVVLIVLRHRVKQPVEVAAHQVAKNLGQIEPQRTPLP